MKVRQGKRGTDDRYAEHFVNAVWSVFISAGCEATGLPRRCA